jgi:Histidine-specific methyltransferase, SAM-dependent
MLCPPQRYAPVAKALHLFSFLLDMKFVSDPVDTLSTTIPDCRSALLAGRFDVPIHLGLTGRASHVERGERECFGAAIVDISTALGPAARVIEIGPFAGLAMGSILNELERPKAAVVMTDSLDTRLFARLQETVSTAEITYIPHDASAPSWPLNVIGAGRTLVLLAGGGFGLMPSKQAFSVLENASHALIQGDFVAVTLEMCRDAAIVDVLYSDYGNQLVTQALSSLGRAEGLEPRTFYDAATRRVRFGAVAGQNAGLAWNGTRCSFDRGTWLDMGAMQLHNPSSMIDLHPDFVVHDQWQSQDKVVTLLLLRKL